MRSALPNGAADVNVSGRTYVKNRVTQLQVTANQWFVFAMSVSPLLSCFAHSVLLT